MAEEVEEQAYEGVSQEELENPPWKEAPLHIVDEVTGEVVEPPGPVIDPTLQVFDEEAERKTVPGMEEEIEESSVEETEEEAVEATEESPAPKLSKPRTNRK